MEQENKKTIHILKLVIIGITCFAVLVFIFGVGVFVGQERARFSFRWAENYHRNFGGPKEGFFYNFPAGDFINSHGIFGPIIKIDANIITIKDQDGMEKTIKVFDKTTIKNNLGMQKLLDLKVGDTIVVIGSPNGEGQIEAGLIRVMPPVTLNHQNPLLYNYGL